MIVFNTDDIAMPHINERQVCKWLRLVAAGYGFTIGDLNYIFCSDKRILEVNNQFLQHDYYTDVITFDYCAGNILSGDIFISLETVESNAQELGVDSEHELLRIIVHGLLHLTGQADKTPETKAEMTRKEDAALKLVDWL